MSRSNYYEMRDAKVRIAHELMNRGWKVLGYKPNESDSMTDYYSPANWGGVATKNGFVLCVDTPYSAESKPIIKYNYGACLSQSDKEKIKKLEAMTVERGATEGEEANAKTMIEKIKANTSDKPTEEITGYTVAHMANPGKCKWHIEKDGSLYDKGTGITKYSKVPDEYRFDINTMQYKDGYRYYSAWEDGEPVRKENTITDEERKVINEFKALILRWERIVNNMNGMYDGTAENKKEAEQQAQNEKMVKVIEKVTKKVLKMVEVTDRKNIQVGDYITVPHHGHYWKVTNEYMQKGTWKGVTESRKAFVYEIVGSASRGYQKLKNPKSYYNYEFRMLKDIEAGTTKIFELKEVEEVTEVEKWVKAESIYKGTKKETKENVKNEEVKEVNNSEEVTEQATKKQLWALHVATKLDTRELKITKNQASELITKSINGTDITDEIKKLMGLEVEEQQEENPYKPEFKEGYIYNVHFKEWDLSITEIKESLTELGLQYKIVDMGNKIGLVGLTYAEVMQVKELNSKNGSILFKDVELNEEEFSITESLIDYSTSLVAELELFKTEWSNNEVFKNRFAEYMKAKNITIITANIVQYLENITYNELVKVLKDLCQPQEESNNINSSNNSDTSINQEEELEKENSSITDNAEQIQEEQQENNKNESEKVRNMSSIFNKFQNVKIENTERVSKEDKQFCIEQQEVYNQGIKLTDSFIEQLIPLLEESRELSKKSNINSYSSSHKTALYHFYSIKEFEDKKQSMKNDFINFTIWYFRDKYNVTIDIEKVQKKYKDTSIITYDNILDEIFLQLNGLTFIEKEENEITSKLKEYSRSYRDNNQRTRVTKSKVMIDSFVAMDSWDIKWGGTVKVHYNYESNLVDLVKGLKHFTKGTTKLSKEEYSFARETLRNNVGEVHNVNYDNVESIKIYKNGKCEIIFSNSQYAKQFAKKYLSLSNVV